MRGTDAQMLVLTVLAGGPLHGYAINVTIETLTGSRLSPGRTGAGEAFPRRAAVALEVIVVQHLTVSPRRRPTACAACSPTPGTSRWKRPGGST